MLRRHPTRIELKLDDLEEFEEKKQERKQQQSASTIGAEFKTPDQSAMTPKTKREMIHERIGYDPQPMLQPSRLPLH